MRNLLECFKGRVRIVGFREHIFSESGGAVAHFAASNEFVFGTMVQRFLTWPLCVRFHYGHPDLWDKVWALSSGGVSKASRTLHVSEDIYGGLNAVLRGGGVEYEEYIHCGKARDITFAASNSFEQKISGGNAWQGMSRDFHRAAKSFDLFRLLSLFVTGTGLFATSSLMFWALGWFTLALTGFALVGLESFTVDGDEVYFDITGTGGSEVYSAQWFVQLGFTLVFPLFLEHAGTLPTLVITPAAARRSSVGPEWSAIPSVAVCTKAVLTATLRAAVATHIVYTGTYGHRHDGSTGSAQGDRRAAAWLQVSLHNLSGAHQGVLPASGPYARFGPVYRHRPRVHDELQLCETLRLVWMRARTFTAASTYP